jgi:RHS repeat-associated protein
MVYVYDNTGNGIRMTYPNDVSFSFEYDNRNRLARIPGYFGSVDQPWQMGFTYDANGHLASSTSINGVSTGYTTDAQGRLKSITATRQQPFENILQLGYSYTSQGNVSRISGINGGSPFELNYGYDRINRLTFAQVPRPGGMANATYQYDGAGNRTVESWSDTGTVQCQYLPGNYLRTRGTTAYSWGPYGQLTSKTQGQTRTDYAYSAQRLMSEVKVDGAALAKYEYDAMGRRIRAIEGESTVITLHSGNDIVYEVRTMSQAAGSNAGLNAIPGDPIIVDPIGLIIEDPPTSPVTEYDRLVTCYLVLNGKHLAKVVQQDLDSAEAYFCHTDMLGSIRAITDSSGEVAARFEYEPFGLVATSTGPLASGAHRFTGKPEDGAIGFYYFGARYYDPEVGRFTSRDPIYHGANWYSYCSSNPLASCDRNGLRDEPGTGSGVIRSEQELFIVETQEAYPGFVWDSRNQAPFHTQFFAWLNDHPKERGRVFPEPNWSLRLGLSAFIWPYGVEGHLDLGARRVQVGKTLSAQSIAGFSFDTEFSRRLRNVDVRVETTVGLNKHFGIGALWDLHEDGRASWAGLALHVGPGYGLPISLTVPIPKHAPPFGGII